MSVLFLSFCFVVVFVSSSLSSSCSLKIQKFYVVFSLTQIYIFLFFLLFLSYHRAGLPVDMSEAHKPGRPSETERIHRAQGWISEERELYMGRLHRMDLSDPSVREQAKAVTWVTIHRVCGELAVSRSIGDPDYKGFVPGEVVEAFFSWPEGHSKIFQADLVIPDPELKSVELTSQDEFLILASDGLWDVVSAQDAVARVSSALGKGGKTVTDAAEELCDLALKLGSSDNVTIVIVKFIHSL